jgi:hypothetical protein
MASPEEDKLEKSARLRAELERKAESDPEFRAQLQAVLRVMEENSEVLQRLADA